MAARRHYLARGCFAVHAGGGALSTATQLELDPTIMERRTLTYGLGTEHALYAAFAALGEEDEE
jgi:hypothetical protein